MECKKCHLEIPDNSVFCCHCGKKQITTPRKKPRRENRTGCIYKAPGNRSRPWVARYQGTYIGYFQTKAEAAVALQEVIQNPVTEYYNLTVAGVFELWKSEHYRDLTPKGQEMYNAAYKHIAPLEQVKFRNLRVADMQQIIDRMESAGKSTSTCAKVKQLFGQMYKWAMREHITIQNYAPFVKLPKEQKKEKTIFSDSDIKTLLENTDIPAVRIILILIFSGLRIGELFGMQKANVHIEKGYMVGGEKTKAGRDRIIPISPIIADYVRELYNSADGDLLISGYSGNQILHNFRERDFNDTVNNLGINSPPKTPHSTRHTFASLAVRAGVKPEYLQQIIGHANYATTVNIYNHTNISDLLSSVQKISIQDGK